MSATMEQAGELPFQPANPMGVSLQDVIDHKKRQKESFLEGVGRRAAEFEVRFPQLVKWESDVSPQEALKEASGKAMSLLRAAYRCKRAKGSWLHRAMTGTSRPVAVPLPSDEAPACTAKPADTPTDAPDIQWDTDAEAWSHA